ncbi:hypothetical protein HK099_007092 [Clydaea vesicula]|uniref:Uncharacterized protein n=1 Tax=Clydaea vesicula TaxID=447962 RepID=A0AAD5U5P5_9FUNG|nr:hypothetical protein HK099_007092 [Clydaea vesicula]
MISTGTASALKISLEAFEYISLLVATKYKPLYSTFNCNSNSKFSKQEGVVIRCLRILSVDSTLYIPSTLLFTKQYDRQNFPLLKITIEAFRSIIDLTSKMKEAKGGLAPLVAVEFFFNCVESGFIKINRDSNVAAVFGVWEALIALPLQPDEYSDYLMFLMSKVSFKKNGERCLPLKNIAAIKSLAFMDINAVYQLLSVKVKEKRWHKPDLEVHYKIFNHYYLKRDYDNLGIFYDILERKILPNETLLFKKKMYTKLVKKFLQQGDSDGLWQFLEFFVISDDDFSNPVVNLKFFQLVIINLCSKAKFITPDPRVQRILDPKNYDFNEVEYQELNKTNVTSTISRIEIILRLMISRNYMPTADVKTISMLSQVCVMLGLHDLSKEWLSYVPSLSLRKIIHFMNLMKKHYELHKTVIKLNNFLSAKNLQSKKFKKKNYSSMSEILADKKELENIIDNQLNKILICYGVNNSLLRCLIEHYCLRNLNAVAELLLDRVSCPDKPNYAFFNKDFQVSVKDVDYDADEFALLESRIPRHIKFQATKFDSMSLFPLIINYVQKGKISFSNDLFNLLADIEVRPNVFAISKFFSILTFKHHNDLTELCKFWNAEANKPFYMENFLQHPYILCLLLKSFTHYRNQISNSKRNSESREVVTTLSEISAYNSNSIQVVQNFNQLFKVHGLSTVESNVLLLERCLILLKDSSEFVEMVYNVWIKKRTGDLEFICAPDFRALTTLFSIYFQKMLRLEKERKKRFYEIKEGVYYFLKCKGILHKINEHEFHYNEYFLTGVLKFNGYTLEDFNATY